MNDPIPMNDLDRAIRAFQRSQAALPDLLRLLCTGNLWLLIPYHPEVANQKMQYLEGQPMPFLRIQTSKGVKVAVFSSMARALEGLNLKVDARAKKLVAAGPVIVAAAVPPRFGDLVRVRKHRAKTPLKKAKTNLRRNQILK